MSTKIIYIPLFMFALLGDKAYSQPGEISVRGIVKDSKGETLPGVSVKIKNTTVGTSTDTEGRYTLNAAGNAVLIFTFVGYEVQEVTLNNRSTINVMLNSSSELFRSDRCWLYHSIQ
jgi:TonB-dependent starch-binding outer membrane protein SusC